MAQQKKLKNLDLNNPFYSDEAICKWKKRLQELIRAEKELGKTRRQPTEDIQETPTQED